MKQIARNVTGSDGPLLGACYLIHDRNSKYTQSFDQILQAAGTAPVKLPPQSPNLNAFADRQAGCRSVKWTSNLAVRERRLEANDFSHNARHRSYCCSSIR
jgi:putative transposase